MLGWVFLSAQRTLNPNPLSSHIRYPELFRVGVHGDETHVHLPYLGFQDQLGNSHPFFEHPSTRKPQIPNPKTFGVSHFGLRVWGLGFGV